MKSKYILARFTFWFFRFKTLARAIRIFSSVESPCLIRRSLFKYEFCLDVSRSITHQLLFLEGERYIQERFLLSTLLKPGMRVVDVGANIGYYLLIFEKCIKPEGEVICIEPSPQNIVELKKNIMLNGFTNVKLFETAIGMNDGDIGLCAGVNGRVNEKEAGTYLVTLRRLDSLVTDKVDFLKIDVEGYEGQVLEGALEVISRDKPLIFLELHPHLVPKFGFSIEQILDNLSKIYKKIDIYECRQNDTSSFIQKLSERYLGKDNLVKYNPIEYMSKYSQQRMPNTFWAVCSS